MTDPKSEALTALALEILDTLVVIATPGWTELSVSIERRDAKPFAHSIVARERAPRDARAELGLDLGEVRASLDAALDELDELLGRGALASLAVHRASDVDATVALLASDARLLAEVPLDERLYPYRVYTEALFDAALAAAKIDEGQRALSAEAQGHDDWEYDAKTLELQLKKGVLPWRVYRAQVIATWAKESETLLWGWANDELPERSKSLSNAARESTKSHPGLGALRRPHLPADEPFAGALARMAAARVGAWAVYPAVYESGVIYLGVLRER
jgi:hypothetical protein